MENYGHIGVTSPEGTGVGEFTIYDWGNGAAAEAYNRIRDHYGDLYIDSKRGRAFAINKVRVTGSGEYSVTNLASTAREVRVVTAAGARHTLSLAPNGAARI